VSEQQPEPISGETGSVGIGPAAPDLSAAAGPNDGRCDVESPRLAPEQEETSPKADAPKVEAIKVEAPKVEAPKVEANQGEPPRPEAQRSPASS